MTTTGAPPGLLQDDSRGLSEALAAGWCRKCHGPMGPSKAMEQTHTSSSDFVGTLHVCSVSPGGPGKLVDCVKCGDCGWSVTP